MKTFLAHNWYKLMITSSFLIFSVGFLIYAVSPAYANAEKTTINTNPTTPLGGAMVVVSNGYLFYWGSSDYVQPWIDNGTNAPKKRKLPL